MSSDAPKYTYTPEHVTTAFNEIKTSRLNGITVEDTPKILVVAGLQGSGKTYLLEKTLVPSMRYDNYVRLYLPEYREKHPQYAEMIKQGFLHAYEHTEAFVREVGAKIFAHAFNDKYNIIMECAFDSIAFAAFPLSATAVGYRFEIHIVGCNREFAHLSSIKRVLKSLDKQELERFVTSSTLDASMGHAKAILLAFERAAKAVSGAQITLYERGFGKLTDRIVRASTTYSKDVKGSLTITGSPVYEYRAYKKIVNRRFAMSDRDEIVKESYQALLKTSMHTPHVPEFVSSDLISYIGRYVYR